MQVSLPTDQQGRRLFDLYPTETRLTRVLLTHYPRISGVVLEPFSGPGKMSNILRTHKRFTVVTNEVQTCFPADYHTDYLDTRSHLHLEVTPDWVVTNCPFSLASEAIPLAFNHARSGVAFLLRLSYLEPTKDRATWMQKHANHLRCVIPVNPRPNFRKDEINPKTGLKFGTDNVTVAWFVWDKGFSWEESGMQCPFIFVSNWRD